MEQRIIAIIYFVETLLVGFTAVIAGCVGGTILSGILTNIVLSSTGGDFQYKIGIYPDTFIETILFFLIIFFIVGLFNTKKLTKTKLIQLAKEDKITERKCTRPAYYLICTVISIISYGIAFFMIKDFLSQGRTYAGQLPSTISNKYQTIIGIGVIIGTFSGYYALSYLIIVIKKKSKHYKFQRLNSVFIGNLYARMTSNAKVIASTTIAIGVSLLGFVIAPVLADITEGYLQYRIQLPQMELCGIMT